MADRRAVPIYVWTNTLFGMAGWVVVAALLFVLAQRPDVPVIEGCPVVRTKP